MGKPELQVLKAVIEFCCPWCRQVLKVTLGRGPHRCPGCQAEITDHDLAMAMVSTAAPDGMARP